MMRAALGIVAVAWLLGCTAPADIDVSALTLNDAPPGASMRAGYLRVTNNTATDLRLVSATSTAFGKVEFHRSSEVDGQARMRREDNVTVGAGETVVLEPFGLHLMLMMPTQPPTPDAAVAIELCFDNGTCVVSRTATS